MMHQAVCVEAPVAGLRGLDAGPIQASDLLRAPLTATAGRFTLMDVVLAHLLLPRLLVWTGPIFLVAGGGW